MKVGPMTGESVCAVELLAAPDTQVVVNGLLGQAVAELEPPGNVRVGAWYAGAHEPRLAAREHHSPEHGPERRGVDASAMTRGEVRGHGIRLLRGEAALLDGEIDRVAAA